jgi:LysM repeat protein
MHNRHSISRFLLVLALVCLAAGPLTSTPAAAQGTNLLQNPGFEGAYTAFANDPNRLVAPNWSAWNAARKLDDPGFILVPQYRSSTNPKRIRGGRGAQEFFEFFAAFTGGVFQRVQVARGTRVKFSVFINVWSTSLNDPDRSEQPSTGGVQVGIDPQGGTDGESTNIVWSQPQLFFDQYRELTVEATAGAGFVTAFVKATLPDPVQHNHVFVDDATLTATGGPAPTNTPTVRPTNTPVVIVITNTPAPATNTPPGAPPTPTPETSLPTPTREGTIEPQVPTPTAELPPTQPLPTPTPSPLDGLPGRVLHIVAPGDSVSGLALRYNTRVEAIIALNNLNSVGLIIVGQQLTIPVPGTPTPTPSQIPTAFPTLRVGTLPPPTAPVLTSRLDGPTVNGIGTYIMQPGDTLAAVAKRYNVTVEELARLNGIVNPDRVVIGQVLAVPGPGNNRPGGTIAPTIIPTSAAPAAGTRPATHTVAPGENLFRISLRYGITMDALMRANGILNPNLIFVGQVLRLP